MEKEITGYLIEYSTRDDMWKWGEKKYSFCSQEKLIALLKQPHSYFIYKTQWANLTYMKKHNPDLKVNILE